MTNWPTKKLTEVCDIVYGFAFKANEFNEASKGLPVIRIGDVDKDKTDKFFDGKHDEKYVVNRGDILLGLSGSFKANRWSGSRALLNQRVATLRNFENKTAESFIFYQLPRLFRDLERIITQLSVKNILTKHIDSLRILYPPLTTQKQIVERLDKIAEAQKLNDELIQKSDELFQSLLHQELNPVGKDWEIKKLSEASFVTSGGTPSRKKPEFYGGTIPWVKSGELKDGFIWDTEEKITDEAVNKSSAKLFPIDTVLIAMYGATVGKVGMLKISATTNQAIAGIQPKKNMLNPYFIFYFFLLIAPILVEKSVGGAQPNINQGIIKNTKIPLPPLNIQKQIVEKLSAVQEYKGRLLEQKSKLKELFESVLYKSMNT